MDLESKKYKIIEKLMKVSDEETLYKIEQVINDIESDSISDLPDIAKQLLKKSEEEISNGQTLTHEQVMANIKSKYNLD